MFITQATVDAINARHMEAQRKLNTDKDREIRLLKEEHEYVIKRLKKQSSDELNDIMLNNGIELDKMKARMDIKEMELMAKVREANNDVQLTKENMVLVADRITADADSRVITVEKAMEAKQEALLSQARARGEVEANRIIKEAYNTAQCIVEDIIENILLKMPTDTISITEVAELVKSATSNFPKIAGNATITNSNSK